MTAPAARNSDGKDSTVGRAACNAGAASAYALAPRAINCRRTRSPSNTRNQPSTTFFLPNIVRNGRSWPGTYATAPSSANGYSSSWKALQGAMRRRAGTGDLAFLVFDPLWLRGESLLAVPYHKRRERLEALELPPSLAVSPLSPTGRRRSEQTMGQGYEGGRSQAPEVDLQAERAHAALHQD